MEFKGVVGCVERIDTALPLTLHNGDGRPPAGGRNKDVVWLRNILAMEQFTRMVREEQTCPA